jgi:hypothetical protein
VDVGGELVVFSKETPVRLVVLHVPGHDLHVASLLEEPTTASLQYAVDSRTRTSEVCPKT